MSQRKKSRKSNSSVRYDHKIKEPLTPICDLEALLVRRMPWWKRTMDIGGALFALILFSPIMLLAAAAIKFTSSGPVIFKQKRAGLGGRSFDLYKFRSMVVNAEALKKDLLKDNEQTGPVFKMKNDPRVTPVGKFLRMTSMDEVPQLLNVLKGDMSLVGPRPPTLDEVLSYEPWQRRRLQVTPGITCIWQVSGRSNVKFMDWVRMDILYIRTRGVLQDVKLILKTIPAIIFSRGAY